MFELEEWNIWRGFLSVVRKPLHWPGQQNQFIGCSGFLLGQHLSLGHLYHDIFHCLYIPFRHKQDSWELADTDSSWAAFAAPLLPALTLPASRPRTLLASCLHMLLMPANICQVLIMFDKSSRNSDFIPPTAIALKMPDSSWSLFRGSKAKASLIRAESPVIPSLPILGAKTSSAREESHLD